MLLYLANMVRGFMPLSFVAGLMLALSKHGREPGKALRSIVISSFAGLLSGIPVYLLSVQYERVTGIRVCLDSAGIIAAVLNACALFLSENGGKLFPLIRRGAGICFITVLACASMFSFLDIIAEHALSSIAVLNTDLILNIGGILLGACLMAFLIPLTAQISGKRGKPILLVFLATASVLLVIPWSAEVLLGLMRLEVIDSTSVRLSFVAKATKYANLVPYIQIFLIMVLAIIFFLKKRRYLPDDLFQMQRAERRKARGKGLFEIRWFKSALASIFVMLTILLSFDLYASRPARISRPVRVTADSKGLIKIRINDVKDGNLHRYSYVTDDGHVVRFILINRMSNRSGRSRIGVVYDACMLCGDMGYIQQKNEVICIACNVRVFTPSIGKAGGCNPIPLNHSVEGGEIVISAEELNKGARYFSQD